MKSSLMFSPWIAILRAETIIWNWGEENQCLHRDFENPFPCPLKLMVSLISVGGKVLGAFWISLLQSNIFRKRKFGVFSHGSDHRSVAESISKALIKRNWYSFKVSRPNGQHEEGVQSHFIMLMLYRHLLKEEKWGLHQMYFLHSSVVLWWGLQHVG